MATQQKDELDAPITLTAGALKEMLSALVAEMKKPHVDEDVVARNEAAKLRLRTQRLESERDKKAIEDSCSHLRQDGSARIAWAENFYKARQLYVTEGTCQNCNKHFHPDMQDKEEYVRMLRTPRGNAGLIS